MAERRIILIGKIGSGKSATGNTIFMRKRFPVSTGSQETFTTECNLRHELNKSSQVTYHVFDTPGIVGKYGILPENGYMVQQQMVQYCNKPHVFLLVVDPAARDHIIEMITALKTWFGMSILDHTILVFTKGTTYNADETLPSCVRKSNVSLVEEVFGRRMIKIENHGEGRSKSQRHLLSLIDSTCHNGKSFFLVTPKPRYIFNRGVNDRRPEKRTVPYAKPKQRESLNDIPIARGTEQPRRLNQYTHDHGDVYTRPSPTILDIHNEDTEPNVQFEKPHRKQDTGSTKTSFENDAYRMNKEVDLKTTEINIETQIVQIYEGECRETGYVYGRMPKALSQTPRKPLERKDIHRTLECAVNAGRAVQHIKESPLTSIAQLAIIASKEENVEAIRNVVNSEEVQIAVENTWSFFKEAAIGVGNFVSEVAQEVEKNRRRQLQLEEEQKRRSTHTHFYND